MKNKYIKKKGKTKKENVGKKSENFDLQLPQVKKVEKTDKVRNPWTACIPESRLSTVRCGPLRGGSRSAKKWKKRGIKTKHVVMGAVF